MESGERKEEEIKTDSRKGGGGGQEKSGFGIAVYIMRVEKKGRI